MHLYSPRSFQQYQNQEKIVFFSQVKVCFTRRWETWLEFNDLVCEDFTSCQIDFHLQRWLFNGKNNNSHDSLPLVSVFLFWLRSLEQQKSPEALTDIFIIKNKVNQSNEPDIYHHFHSIVFSHSWQLYFQWEVVNKMIKYTLSMSDYLRR